MALRDFIGNKSIVNRLIEAVRTETISHAYLFEGDGKMDKKAFAIEFVKTILCKQPLQGDACGYCVNCRKVDHGNYEDLIEITADGNSIKDEVILSLQGRISKKPGAGDRHIVIIENADTMTLRAQNRLLKTLEEPKIGTVIVLLSENVEHLTKTILSRCVIFHVQSEGKLKNGAMEEKAGIFVQMATGGAPFYRLAEVIGEVIQEKGEAYDFLDCLEQRYRDMVVCAYDPKRLLRYDLQKDVQLPVSYREDSVRAICAIEEARRELDRNINTAYALKAMALRL